MLRDFAHYSEAVHIVLGQLEINTKRPLGRFWLARQVATRKVRADL